VINPRDPHSRRVRCQFNIHYCGGHIQCVAGDAEHGGDVVAVRLLRRHFEQHLPETDDVELVLIAARRHVAMPASDDPWSGQRRQPNGVQRDDDVLKNLRRTVPAQASA
jgi:hypothetical protein